MKIAKPDTVRKPGASEWELKELMERLDGDEELLRELLAIFQQDARTNLFKARDALVMGDFARLTRVAHTLKGMLRNLSMGAAGRTATALEAAAREETMEESRQRLEQLGGELEGLFLAVEARLAEVK